MQCLFDSSEGGKFEFVREPELPSPLAEKYLTETFGVVVDTEVKEYLPHLPRSSNNLFHFAKCVDRKAFVAFLSLVDTSNPYHQEMVFSRI